MMDDRLYRFIKLKSETIPVALIRRSLIRHGYSRRDVDDAASKVIAEERESSWMENKERMFRKFVPEGKTERVEPSESIKYFSLDDLKTMKPGKKVVNKGPMALLRDSLKEETTIDIEALKKEAQQKVQEAQEERQEPKEEDAMKLLDDIKSPEKPKEKEEPKKPHLEERLKPKVHHPFLRFIAFEKMFMRNAKEIDPIKLTYFLLALLSVIGIVVTVAFYGSKYSTFSIRLILAAAVILLLAHNMRHLEMKYGLPKSERKTFELSITVGFAGWMLSTLFNPIYILLLLVPGIFFLTILVKDLYHTSIKVALKMSALTAIAALFAFYGVSIVIGVLVGVRVLI